MRHLNETTTRALVTLIQRAETAVREHAAEQSYRADAAKAVKERILHAYHRNRHEDAAQLADQLAHARTTLSDLKTHRKAG